MENSVSHEAHALPWRTDRPGAHAVRTALALTGGQVEAGHGCPITMTFAAIPALRAQPDVLAAWEPRLTSTQYDPRDVPADEKTGALCGMGMTEKQGGSDVRSERDDRDADRFGGGPGGEYELVGHKWFTSAPMCDLFLVLAQIEDAGISCFAMPRWRPDGERNGFQLQRLKDKLGNRSNASSEIEFRGAWAQLIGEPGRGVPTIIEMVNHTRLDCVVGSAAGMRWAVSLATHHAAYRSAFGKLLIEQPLMTNVLADLCVESEAATLSAMRLARAYDEQDHAFKRIATAVLKYWVCKRTAAARRRGAGGARRQRLRRGVRHAAALPRGAAELRLGGLRQRHVPRRPARAAEGARGGAGAVRGAGGVGRRGSAAGRARREAARGARRLRADIEARARRVVEAMALALQGSLVVRYSPRDVAEAFCASRLAGDAGHAFGTLPSGIDFGAIVERHRPCALSAAHA